MADNSLLRLCLSVGLGSLHSGIYLVLLAAFLQSLRDGRTAIITRLALLIRPALPPEMLAYTRQVTIAWVFFFTAQLIVSLLIFLFAPKGWWLVFIGILNMPLIILMFASEYAFRRLRFRHYRHDTWQEMRQIPARLRGLVIPSK